MRTNRRNNLKIIAASSVAICSLAAVMGGVYAWFTVAWSQTTEVDPFAVINVGSCDLYALELIKFDYKSSTYGTGEGAFTITDYLAPETGAVNKYSYNKNENSFGYLEDSTWHPVNTMNMYDPVNLLIYGTGLNSLNCNAIYKFTITSDDMTNVNMHATIHKLLDRVKQDNEIFLSTCTDFDLFFPSELSDSNPEFIIEDDPSTPEDEYDNKPYYPTYFSKTKVLTELEDIYYKISYLANKKTTHTHLYNTADTYATLYDHSVTFAYDSVLDTNVLSFYINVNYAPDQLEEFKTQIYQRNITAIFDYGFKFVFVREEDGD